MHGTGTATANVTDVAVDCVNNPAPEAQVTAFAGSTTGGFTDGPLATATFLGPMGMAFDASGNTLVVDSQNSSIRMNTPAGVVSTVVGTNTVGVVDGPAATARFRYPSAVTLGPGGDMYIVDSGNHSIRKFDGTTVSTLAGSAAGTPGYADGTGTAALFTSPTSAVLHADGNLYVTEFNNHVIRKITLAGSSVAFGNVDGTGAAARFISPSDIQMDAFGNLFVVDISTNTIRKITPAGVVTTIAGSTTSGTANGSGSVARFSAPISLAMDSARNLYVTELNRNTIRKITLP